MTNFRTRLLRGSVGAALALGLLVGSAVEADADTLSLTDPAHDSIGLVDITAVQIVNGADVLTIDVVAPGFDPALRSGPSAQVTIWSALYVGLDLKRDDQAWTLTMAPAEAGDGVRAGLGVQGDDDEEAVPCPGLGSSAVVGRLRLSVPQSCFGGAAGTVRLAVQLDGRADFVELPTAPSYSYTFQPQAADSTATTKWLSRG